MSRILVCIVALFLLQTSPFPFISIYLNHMKSLCEVQCNSSSLTVVTFSCRCIVCLADYHHEDTLRILPNCGHSFHVNCIDIWFQQHSTCPICRVSLRDVSEKKHIMQPMFSTALRAHRVPEPFFVHPLRCVYAGQNFQVQTVRQLHAGPTQEDNHGPQNAGTEARDSIPAVDDEQSQLPGNKKEKHLESPSNVQVS